MGYCRLLYSGILPSNGFGNNHDPKILQPKSLSKSLVETIFHKKFERKPCPWQAEIQQVCLVSNKIETTQ